MFARVSRQKSAPVYALRSKQAIEPARKNPSTQRRSFANIKRSDQLATRGHGGQIIDPRQRCDLDFGQLECPQIFVQAMNKLPPAEFVLHTEARGRLSKRLFKWSMETIEPHEQVCVSLQPDCPIGQALECGMPVQPHVYVMSRSAQLITSCRAHGQLRVSRMGNSDARRTRIGRTRPSPRRPGLLSRSCP